MDRRNARRNHRVVHGTRNVFADLDYPDALERLKKLRLAYLLNCRLAHRELTLAEVADVLSLKRSQVSDLEDYNLSGFTVKQLAALASLSDGCDEGR
jgi:predicted XRE-type DNA-binding protein